jgi:hypothetical protein
MCFFYISYVVEVAILFQCASLIELNACEDENFIAIKILPKKKESKKSGKKEEEKEVIQFMINAPMLANWVQIEIPNIFLKTIQVYHNKIYF